MASYSEEIKSLLDFRNNVVALCDVHDLKLGKEVRKVYDLLYQTYHIPDEADIHVEYDIDNNVLVLESDISLDIRNEKGFNVFRKEKLSVTDLGGYFSVVEDDVTYKYYFRLV